MPTPSAILGDTVLDLPPLILHPFNERIPPSTLLENSKAALMLSGLMPNDGTEPEELHRRLLSGRYAEVRMLFFLGKDVLRWIEQCVDCASRVPQLSGVQLRAQSFAGLLTQDTPEDVKDKLVHWGVADYVSIFARAIGLNTLFTGPPPFDLLAEEFLHNYHRYADALFRCYMDLEPHAILEPRSFKFGLYASGEYSRMLESEWETEAE
jgi:hypothetical protein